MIRHPGLCKLHACPLGDPTSHVLASAWQSSRLRVQERGIHQMLACLSSASAHTRAVAAQHPAWPDVQTQSIWLNQIGQMDQALRTHYFATTLGLCWGLSNGLSAFR